MTRNHEEAGRPSSRGAVCRAAGLSLALAALAAAGAIPAPAATLRHEVDVRVQQRFQKTTNGARSAIPEEYGEKPNGLIVERYKVELESEKYFFEAQVTNASKNDQAVVAEGGQPGRFTWKGGWDRSPHLFSNEARSLYSYQGSGIMSLPDPLQSYFQTNSATFNKDIMTAMHSAPYQRLGFDVDTGRLDLRLRPGPDFTVEVGAWRQARTGTRSQMASFAFSNAIELAAPIDTVATEAYLDLQLVRKDYQFGFGYRVSEFDNRIPNLYWDNPKRLNDRAASASGYSTGDQGASGAMALAPNNIAHSFKLEGGVNLPMRSRLSLEGGYQLWTAMNPMLPYTNNTCLRPGCVTAGTVPPFDASLERNRPDSDVDGKMQVYTYLFKLSSRPIDRLRWSLAHDAYILENNSKQYDLPGFAVFDQIWDAEAVTTPREELREDKTTVKLDVNALSWLGVNVGGTHKYMKRTREIDKTREWEGTGGLSVRPVKDLWVNASYLLNMRRGNGMSLTHYPKTTSATTGRTYFSEGPGMRRPDVADRNRNQARLQAQWTPGETSVSLSARLTDDRYRPGKGPLNGDDPFIYPNLMGIIEDRSQAYGVDVSVPVVGTLTVDAFYEWDYSRRRLRSSQTACAGSVATTGAGATASTRFNTFNLPGEPQCGAAGSVYVMLQDPRTQWETLIHDHSHVTGLALNWQPLERLKTSAGYDLVMTRQDFLPENAGSFAVGRDANGSPSDPYEPFPSSRRVTHFLKARAEYKLTDAVSLTANYGFERFYATDFAYGDVPLRDASASTFLGVNPIRNYYAHMASAGVSMRF